MCKFENLTKNKLLNLIEDATHKMRLSKTGKLGTYGAVEMHNLTGAANELLRRWKTNIYDEKVDPLERRRP